MIYLFKLRIIARVGTMVPVPTTNHNGCAAAAGSRQGHDSVGLPASIVGQVI